MTAKRKVTELRKKVTDKVREKREQSRSRVRRRASRKRAASAADDSSTPDAGAEATTRDSDCRGDVPMQDAGMSTEVSIATYNIHRWTGLNGRSKPDPARAGYVISELDADIIALQEVLRPFTESDPLRALADALGLHFVFAPTRIHKRGELGNAILSRFEIESLSVLDISYSRVERRGALAARFAAPAADLGVVATHLSLVDRTRHRQVQSLLDHPQFGHGPTVLLGDMNAWRQCAATRSLEDNLQAHHNQNWPASFPAARPVLALDRIYARGAKVREIRTHDTAASRRASDHLPVLATLDLTPEV